MSRSAAAGTRQLPAKTQKRTTFHNRRFVGENDVNQEAVLRIVLRRERPPIFQFLRLSRKPGLSVLKLRPYSGSSCVSVLSDLTCCIRGSHMDPLEYMYSLTSPVV